MMRVLHKLYDERSKSLSVMVTMTVDEYLRLVRKAYESDGRIEGQRTRLKTTSALRIRKRMVTDLEAGAVLPPVVVGVLLDKDSDSAFAGWTDNEIVGRVEEVDLERISIIDGMQRTSVLLELKESIEDRDIRVELWLANYVSRLTYRMLILNSGQIPWTLRRQMEVVYSSLISEFKDRLGDQVTLFGIGESRRRSKAGEFQANDVVEMYMAFGLRKAKVNTESVLADEFSRLDMIEAVSSDNFVDSFVMILTLLARFDSVFSKYDEGRIKADRSKFETGRSVFDSQPARIGFVTAAAWKIFGRPGSDRDSERQQQESAKIAERCNLLLDRLHAFDSQDLDEFLALKTLNELVSNRVSTKIGDFERDFFTEAFRVLFSEDVDIGSMEACWRAH